ncbi:TPA: hypothetical protein ACWLUJ_006183 [Pseudomonas aeruginosa]|nr:hypothetical protein [Pseudomonas aeruginosa]EIU2863530.1 hypothetical protein [Pseudomonas aeruginosa]HEJ2342717.1 hypothetical protein [Pseudomonas aeruginosa]HEK3717296.1 hypothetical protein [Pseudomonas aeruginosa]
MVEINIPREVREALKSLDTAALSKQIDEIVERGVPGYLHLLGLSGCGHVVAARLHTFEMALSEHSTSRSDKKRSETGYRVSSAARDLRDAVQHMKDRVAKEEQEGEFFQVADPLGQPFALSEKMTVSVQFQWRKTTDDDWTSGSIAFNHVVDMRPDFSQPPPSRKPSANNQAKEREARLYREWERLMTLAHLAVKEYFRKGNDGADIPESFQVRTSPHSRSLNNHSASFWLE